MLQIKFTQYYLNRINIINLSFVVRHKTNNTNHKIIHN